MGAMMGQRRPAMIPSLAEGMDELFHLIHLFNMNAQQRDAGGGKKLIHKHVALFAGGLFVTVIIQLDP